MKLRLHHIEMCVQDPGPVSSTLCNQFGFNLVGRRETELCEQRVVRLDRTVFVITSRKKKNCLPSNGQVDKEVEAQKIGGCWNDGDKYKDEKDCNSAGSAPLDNYCEIRKSPKLASEFQCDAEPWTIFCCSFSQSSPHIDSVFNIAIELEDLKGCLKRLEHLGVKILQRCTHAQDEHGSVHYAIIKSCCGNVVHTLIEKNNYSGWFLPAFEQVQSPVNLDAVTEHDIYRNTFFDHVALVCRMGDTNSIIHWYEDAFEMRRFITNRDETEEDGLMIGGDVGLRLKVMEFWKCSEVGLASSTTDCGEVLKIVVAESLPSIRNTQVENFISDHHGPGLQHIGLHTSEMVETVQELARRGVRFRQPPPTYYTEIGQLSSIQAVGEDVQLLAKHGILLDDEADPFYVEEKEEMELEPDDQLSAGKHQRYLMQIFTYPIFDRDTFFLEVIQRRGARGFGVGNVTALARSVNAYQEQLRRMREKTNNA